MSHRTNSTDRPETADTPGNSRVFDVPGISCDHCKTAIEAAVGNLHGVDAANVDVASKTVVVTGGDAADIVAAIRSSGYEVA